MPLTHAQRCAIAAKAVATRRARQAAQGQPVSTPTSKPKSAPTINDDARLQALLNTLGDKVKAHAERMAREEAERQEAARQRAAQERAARERARAQREMAQQASVARSVLGLNTFGYVPWEQVKSAYRAKALQYHPDRVAVTGMTAEAAAAAMQQVTVAYQQLAREYGQRA
jgi:hypothetical protein